MSYFKAKMHQIRFPPDPVLGVHKLDLKGPTSKGRGGSTGVRRRWKGFFFIFKHLWALKRSWKISRGGAEKSWIFLSVKEWEPWVNNLVLILQLLDASVLSCVSAAVEQKCLTTVPLLMTQSVLLILVSLLRVSLFDSWAAIITRRDCKIQYR